MKTLNITKSDIKANQIESTVELADFYNLDYVETSSESNGYPNNLEWAIIADTISELLEIKEQLKNAGFNVQEYFLHKKNGWQLWSRQNTYLEKGQMTIASDSDWYWDFDMTDLDEVKKEVYEMFWCDEEQMKEIANEQVEDGIYDTLKEALNEYAEQVQFFINQLPKDGGQIRVFYDPNQDYAIDYIVTEESTYYYNDTNHYRLAIAVDFEDYNF